MSKFVGTGPSSYEKRIYRAAVSQRLRNWLRGLAFSRTRRWLIFQNSKLLGKLFWTRGLAMCLYPR